MEVGEGGLRAALFFIFASEPFKNLSTLLNHDHLSCSSFAFPIMEEEKKKGN